MSNFDEVANAYLRERDARDRIKEEALYNKYGVFVLMAAGAAYGVFFTLIVFSLKGYF